MRPGGASYLYLSGLILAEEVGRELAVRRQAGSAAFGRTEEIDLWGRRRKRHEH